MLFTRSLVVLVSLAAASIAAPASSSTSTRCWTTMGSSSVRNCPTRWTTTTLSCTSTSTVVITKSSTPQAKTSTVIQTTVTTKTGSSPVSTATSTILLTSTTTLVSTTISSYLSTSVFSTASTTTVSSSADFVPVQSSFPGATYDGNPNPNAAGPARRDESELTRPVEERDDVLRRNDNRHGGYPQSVSCRAYPSGKCSTTTLTSTTTIVAPAPTSFTTITLTKTVTSNVAATTTTTSSTVTSTVNAITTFISVGTTTTTSYTSIATIYAACGPDNVVDVYMGHPLDGDSDYTGQANPFDLIITTSPAVSYQDCCGQAYIDTNGPLAWLFGSSSCLVIESQGEATVQSQNQLVATYGDGTNGQYAIGNGRVGKWTSASSDGTV